MRTTDGRGGGTETPDVPAVSIVVPAYNEAHRLGDSLPGMLAMASADRELIFVDDGSTDDTFEQLRHTVGSRPGVQVIRLPENRGKGGAIRAGVERATGLNVMYMDADLATDPERTPVLLSALDGAEVAIGSRAIDGTVIEASTKHRSRMGHTFNRIVRASTGLPFRDTQCGFKAFRTDVARLLFHLNEVEGFAFDAVVLASAQHMGLRITEVPVRWREVEGTHVRTVRDPVQMAYDVVIGRRFKVQGVLAIEVTSTAGDPTGDLGDAVARVVGCTNPVVRLSGRVVVFLPFATETEAEAHRRAIETVLGDGHRSSVTSMSAAAAIRSMSRRSALVDQSTTRPDLPSSLSEPAVDRRYTEPDPSRPGTGPGLDEPAQPAVR